MQESGEKQNFTDTDWELIRNIQGDLPVAKRPFLVIAKRLGCSEAEVIKRINGWLDSGIIKRFAALVHHHELGFKGNVMVAWYVPESEVDRVGRTMAAYPFVSHCYERVMRPGWPYNIYTMIHAADKVEAESYVKEMAGQTGVTEYRMLHSVKEWKKKSMEYF